MDGVSFVSLLLAVNFHEVFKTVPDTYFKTDGVWLGKSGSELLFHSVFGISAVILWITLLGILLRFLQYDLI